MKEYRTAGAQRWCLAAMRGVPLAFLVFSALMAVTKLLLDLWYPYGLDYGEGVVLDGVRATLEGRTLYPPLDETFYAVSIYMPLYVWVCAAVAWLTAPTFLVGRIVSLALTLVCAGLVYALARREGASRWWSAMGAGLFLTSIPVVAWGAYMRVDMMGLAFSLGGLLVLSSGASPLWAGLLFSLAILSKQSMLAALFGASLFLAARRRWRELGLLLLATIVPVAAVCAWQVVATEGWFLFHTVKANGVRYSVSWASRYLGEGLVPHTALAVLALAGWWAAGCPGSPRRPSLLTGYLIGACGAALMVGKVGAVVNYFLDYVAALSILAAIGISRVVGEGELRSLYREAFVAAALLIHFGAVTRMPDIAEYVETLPAMRRVTSLLAESRGPVLSDDPSVVAGAGQRLVLEPFQATQMDLSGIWSAGPLVARLRQGDFPLIVLRFDPWNLEDRLPDGTWASGRWSDAMAAAVRHAYRVDERWKGSLVLRPRGK